MSGRRPDNRLGAGHLGRHRPGVHDSEAIEDYAKALHLISERTGEPVATSAVAELLGVSAGSVSAMLKRMATLGLVELESYRGARLSESGRLVALEMVRHHRLIELFLTEVLGMGWDRVHAEAEVLEHYISEELEERMAAALGDPEIDPHGDPIPDRGLGLVSREGVALSDLDSGVAATIARVSDSDPGVLRYLGECGMRPGAELVVGERDEVDGSIALRVGGHSRRVGVGIARRVVVSPTG